ncbi:MAG: class I SAM-dependent methyltransferase [Planctomycetota bacterium]
MLSGHLAGLFPLDAKVLDVGCGDGLVDHLIRQKRPDVEISGIDVLVRDNAHILVTPFDGQLIPYADASFDVVMLVDVLHHTEDPIIILQEAIRVTRKTIVIKDHTLHGLLAYPILRIMDWFGNIHQGVSLPYNYWSEQKWLDAFDSLSLTIKVWEKDLKLYKQPANWIFGKSLHFVTLLELK